MTSGLSLVGLVLRRRLRLAVALCEKGSVEVLVQAGSWINEEVPRTIRIIVAIDHVMDSIAFARVSPGSPDGQVDRWHEPSPLAAALRDSTAGRCGRRLTAGPQYQTT